MFLITKRVKVAIQSVMDALLMETNTAINASISVMVRDVFNNVLKTNTMIMAYVVLVMKPVMVVLDLKIILV